MHMTNKHCCVMLLDSCHPRLISCWVILCEEVKERGTRKGCVTGWRRKFVGLLQCFFLFFNSTFPCVTSSIHYFFSSFLLQCFPFLYSLFWDPAVFLSKTPESLFSVSPSFNLALTFSTFLENSCSTRFLFLDLCVFSPCSAARISKHMFLCEPQHLYNFSVSGWLWLTPFVPPWLPLHEAYFLPSCRFSPHLPVFCLLIFLIFPLSLRCSLFHLWHEQRAPRKEMGVWVSARCNICWEEL